MPVFLHTSFHKDIYDDRGDRAFAFISRSGEEYSRSAIMVSYDLKIHYLYTKRHKQINLCKDRDGKDQVPYSLSTFQMKPISKPPRMSNKDIQMKGELKLNVCCRNKVTWVSRGLNSHFWPDWSSISWVNATDSRGKSWLT